MKAVSYLYIRLLLLLLLSVLAGNVSSQFYIATVAGNGNNGSNGDNGPAICADVPNPQGVCADPTGNLYITSSNSIRRVDAATNIITTIAGSDTYGYSGDGGPAKDALMMYPLDICLDPIGNLYISEYSGNRIRKISTDGKISTVAGTGVEGYSGDNGPATAARLARPNGIFVDGSNNIYIADTYNSALRKIDAATGVITTIAGNGSTMYSGDGGLAVNAGVPYPKSVAVDEDGNVYLLEVNNGITSRLRKIDAVTGIITTIAGSNVYGYSGDGGPAINATLFDPVAVEVDNRGNIYVLEYDAPRLRKIDGATGIISTIAGNGVNAFSGDGGLATLASMNSPGGMGRGFNGAIYIADQQNQRIRKLHPDKIEPIQFSKIDVSGPPDEPCIGSAVSFTAAITNAGSQAKYQWFINSDASGLSSATFVSPDLIEGDSIYCVYTSTHCNQEETITSNKVVVHFASGAAPQISIAASAAKVCSGETVLIAAAVQNASSPAYQWYRNDQPVGNNQPSLSYVPEPGNDKIRCDITTEGCSGGITSSEEVIVGAYASPEVNVTPGQSVVPPGSAVTITANINGEISHFSWASAESLVNENTLTPTTAPVVNNHDVIFTAETVDGCVIRDTAKIFVFVKMVMPNAFSPNGDAINDAFRIPPNVTFRLDEFSVFNRWGKKIFTTADISKGWNGDGADNGTYVYVISGTLDGKKTVFKGYFLLVR
jgi:gliding motility-associated-like protein